MRPPTPLVLAARLLAVAIIALFGVVLALPRGGDGVAIAVTGLLALTLTGVLVAGHLSRRVTPVPAVVTVVGGLAVAGAEMYLHCLPADGADIPLAGVGVLFLGVIALIVGACTLGPVRRPAAEPGAAC